MAFSEELGELLLVGLNTLFAQQLNLYKKFPDTHAKNLFKVQSPSKSLKNLFLSFILSRRKTNFPSVRLAEP